MTTDETAPNSAASAASTSEPKESAPKTVPAHAGGAVTKTARQVLSDLLDAKKGELARVLPKHLTPERLCRIAITAAARNPTLLQCTPASVLQSVMQAAQLGLEAGSALGHAYLVPFRNSKTGNYDCTLIPGYRGLIELVRRSRLVDDIEARVVHQRDTFRVQLGSQPRLYHTPCLDGHSGPPVCCYAVATMRGGARHFEVMTIAEVEAIRGRSRSADSGPWVTDYEEMVRKTVVRRICKYLPASTELASAIEIEEAAERGEAPAIDADYVLSEATASTPLQSATERLKTRLRHEANGPGS